MFLSLRERSEKLEGLYLLFRIDLKAINVMKENALLGMRTA